MNQDQINKLTGTNKQVYVNSAIQKRFNRF